MEPISMLAALGTYLVHSTVLLAAAWALLALARPGAAAREQVWKCAIVLPFVTSALQTAWPERAAASRFRIELPAAGRASFVHAPGWIESTERDRGVNGPATAPVAATPATATPATGEVAGEPGVGSVDVALRAVLLATLVATLLPSVRLLLALRRRRPVQGGTLVEEVESIRRRAGLRRPLRVTVSDRVRSPVALGTLRPEVCVPPRALELARPLARALAAHEVAHHVRMDPLWTRLTHAIATACFFQPLNRLARRELVACAELLADDLAVEWTNDRIGLARCLTEVAGWGRPATSGAAAVAMVRSARSSGLRERVERALDRPRERVGRGVVSLAIALVGVVAATAPGVASGSPPASARALLEALADEVRAADAELSELAGHPDAAIRRRAASLAERRTALALRIESHSRALVHAARERAPLTPIER